MTNVLLALILATLLFGSGAMLGFLQAAFWCWLGAIVAIIVWAILKSAFKEVYEAHLDSARGLARLGRGTAKLGQAVARNPVGALCAVVRLLLIVAFGPLFFARTAVRDIRQEQGFRIVTTTLLSGAVLVALSILYVFFWLVAVQGLRTALVGAP